MGRTFRDRGHDVGVVFLYLLTRAILSFFVDGFEAHTLNYYWQFADPKLLREDLLRTVFYLHSQPPLFNLGLGIRPVDLVEIDRIHPQSPQARFQLAAHGGSLQAVPDLALVVPHQAAFGKNVGTVCTSRDRFADDLFRVPQSVHGRGIDPVDAGIERHVDRRNRFLVLLPSPGEGPVAAAHRPCAHTDGSDLQVRVA